MRAMRILWSVMLVLFAGAAGLGLAGSRTVQLIEPYDAVRRELTGQPGTPVGEPMAVFFPPTRALIDPPPGTPHAYFDRSVAYPVQMRTYWFLLAWTAAGVCVGGGLVTLVVARLSRSRRLNAEVAA